MLARLFALLIALATVSCATPPRPPASTDVGMAGLTSAATQTAVSVAVVRTRAAEGTAQAMTRSQNDAIATQSARAQIQIDDAELQAQVDRERIELDALSDRLAAEARVIADLANIELSNALLDAERRAWAYDIFVGILLLFLAGTGYASVATFVRISKTLRDEDGNVVGFGKTFFLPHEAATVDNDEPIARHIPFFDRQRGRGVRATRRPFRLTDAESGTLVFEFTGKDLDAMELNIAGGDNGFRRDKSTAGEGLDTLAGLTNGTMFSLIKRTMLERTWIREHGNGHKWTSLGRREMLQMDE